MVKKKALILGGSLMALACGTAAFAQAAPATPPVSDTPPAGTQPLAAGASAPTRAGEQTAPTATSAEVVPGATRPDGSTDDIIVTARRKAEPLQTVPVAVTALSGAALQARGVQGLSQLTAVAPSLRIAPNPRGAAMGSVVLRGQENVNQTIANDPAVGIYLDEVYLGRSAGNLLSSLYDVSSAQILRGVQGTLFGRNNTGGAILVTSNRPDPTGVHANIDLAYGSYNRFDAGAVLNVPITSNLAVRGSVLRTRQAGIGRSLTTGIDTYGNRHRDQYRIAAQWQPASNATLYVGYDESSINETGISVASATLAQATANPSTSAIPASGKFEDNVMGLPNPYQRAKARGYTFRGDVDVSDALKLKTIIGRRFVNVQSSVAPDGSPNPNSTVNVLQPSTQDQWSFETQASGTILTGHQGALNSVNYTTGIFYFYEDGTDNTQVNSVTVPLVSGITRLSIGENRSAAGYAQFESRHFNDFYITAGLRFTHEDRAFTAQSTGLPPFGSAAAPCSLTAAGLPATTPINLCKISNSAKFNYWSYSLGIRYQPSTNLNIYAKTDRGQRAGGFATAPTLVQVYQPERHTSYEVGAKLQLLNRKVTANAAAFLDDIDNAQRSAIQVDNTVTPARNYTAVFNVPKAQTKGLEFELAVHPVQGFTLGSSLGLLKTRYINFPDPRIAGGGPNLASVLKYFVNSPRRTYSFYGDYSLPVGSVGVATVHADYAYQSAVYFDTLYTDVVRQPGYGIVNARVSLKLNGRIFGTEAEVAFYARNIANKKYNIFILNAPSSGLVGYGRSDQPRMFGGELHLKY